MEDFKFKGKTIKEWENELETVEGLNENNEPNWWKVQSNLIDATILKKLLKLGINEQNN